MDFLTAFGDREAGGRNGNLGWPYESIAHFCSLTWHSEPVKGAVIAFASVARNSLGAGLSEMGV